MEEYNDIYNDIYNNTYDDHTDSIIEKSQFTEEKINSLPPHIIGTKLNDSPRIVTKKTGCNRTFTGYYINNSSQEVQFGRFIGLKPKQAAAKAFTTLIKLIKSDARKCIKIIETTKGSKNKSFYFECTRMKLECPITVKRPNGKEITYTYYTVVKKSSDDEYKK